VQLGLLHQRQAEDRPRRALGKFIIRREGFRATGVVKDPRFPASGSPWEHRIRDARQVDTARMAQRDRNRPAGRRRSDDRGYVPDRIEQATSARNCAEPRSAAASDEDSPRTISTGHRWAGC